jgi:L-gulonate 5-dehydrogenase
MGNLGQPSAVAQASITRKELTVIGTRLNNRRFPEVIDGMERGIYSPEKLRTHSFHFTKIAEAFDLIINRPELVRKVVLTFD